MSMDSIGFKFPINIGFPLLQEDENNVCFDTYPFDLNVNFFSLNSS